LPSHGKLFIENDAVAALASGTMGKLHGCMLIARTGTIAYGFTSDGREALVAGAGPVLDDWGRLVKRTTFSYVYDSNTTELSLWKLIHIYSVWLLLMNLFNWFTWHFICNGYGISAQAMTVVIRGYDGRGPEMELTNNILDFS